MKVSMNELYECILYLKANKNIKDKNKTYFEGIWNSMIIKTQTNILDDLFVFKKAI
jgi:hypothetical protein